MSAVEIVMAVPGSVYWERLIEYADKCPWRAGPLLSKEMKRGAMTGWERAFAAMDGERPVGFCTLAKTDCIEGVPYRPWVGYVFVDERYRGARLSRRLIDAAAEYARSLGFEFVYLVSDHENLYEKYGFEVVDRRAAPWGAMEKIYRRKT